MGLDSSESVARRCLVMAAAEGLDSEGSSGLLLQPRPSDGKLGRSRIALLIVLALIACRDNQRFSFVRVIVSVGTQRPARSVSVRGIVGG
jgi:hypothetical protein